MKAEKLPSGKYRVRVWDNAKKKQISFTAPTKKEAESKAMQYQLEKGNVPEVTFAEAVEIYLQSRSNILSPSTMASYRMYQRNYYDRLNDLSLGRITDIVLQTWVNDLSERRSAKTVLNIYSHTTAILRVFYPQKAFNVSLPTVVRVKINCPNQGEISQLNRELQDNQLYVPFLLGAFACMRRGEIMALREEDVDFRKGTIRIHSDLVIDENRKWVMKGTKTGQERTIRPPEIVMKAIKKHGLPYRNIANPDRITVEWGRFLKKHGHAPMRFHSLRHFCAAQMLSSGADVPLSVVRDYGGWTNEKVLLNIYNYAIDEVTDKAMSKWNDIADSLAH